MTSSENHRRLPSDVESIAKAVGLIVIQWGQAEQSLDFIVAILWQLFDGKSHAKKIPIMLEKKIRFVRACFQSDAALTKLRSKAEDLLSRFEELSSLRHDLIHSAVVSTSEIDGAFVFGKLDVHDGHHYHREVKIDMSEYPKLIDKLITLGMQGNKLTNDMLDLSEGKDPS